MFMMCNVGFEFVVISMGGAFILQHVTKTTLCVMQPTRLLQCVQVSVPRTMIHVVLTLSEFALLWFSFNVLTQNVDLFSILLCLVLHDWQSGQSLHISFFSGVEVRCRWSGSPALVLRVAKIDRPPAS